MSGRNHWQTVKRLLEPDIILIEVVYALPDKQILVSLEVPPGTTVAQAIELSGIRDQFPDIEINPKRLGIFSVKATADTVLAAGDRLEIYRPLIADPKEARRKRALAEKAARDSRPPGN